MLGKGLNDTKHLLHSLIQKGFIKRILAYSLQSIPNASDLNHPKHLSVLSSSQSAALPSSTHSCRIWPRWLLQLLPPNYFISLPGNRKWERRNVQHLRTPPGSFTCYFHSHLIGQNLVTWSYLATRELENAIIGLGNNVSTQILVDLFLK